MTVVLTDHNTNREGDAVNLSTSTAADGETSSKNRIMELVQLFKLLADETRLKILAILHGSEELNVLELCRLLDQRQPSVSHHLAVLRVAGLIGMRREGKHNFYHIVPKQFERFMQLIFEFAADDSLRIRFQDYQLLLTAIER